ncbi:MAG: SDR family oxidoreductase [Bacteroidia bacterium]|jgi:NADP-dependent 3-hydroxy acid dehydrogenase YdfG|nr:SDR family oxidoreductase [Bacteroidia bacterium]
MKLLKSIAVITGVSKGIGYATASALLQKGAIVYGLGRHNHIVHPNFIFVPCDVRNPNEVHQAFAQIKSTTAAIDILVNNAGLGYFGMLEEMPQTEITEMMETNVNGTIYCCREVLPLMKAQEKGHIINIASTAALEGMPQVAAYCASKWAVKGLSESLFREVRDFNIKVTCIYPGSVKTDFFRNSPNIKPHDYMLMPEDIATNIVHALEMPDNFHTVNLEIRPLRPKGPQPQKTK